MSIGFGGSDAQDKVRTYAEMLEDHSLDPGDRAQIRLRPRSAWLRDLYEAAEGFESRMPLC